jgi:hypothetical protein
MPFAEIHVEQRFGATDRKYLLKQSHFNSDMPYAIFVLADGTYK